MKNTVTVQQTGTNVNALNVYKIIDIYHVCASIRHSSLGPLIFGLYGPGGFCKGHHWPRLVGHAMGGSSIKRSQVVVGAGGGWFTDRLTGSMRVLHEICHEGGHAVKWGPLGLLARDHDMRGG